MRSPDEIAVEIEGLLAPYVEADARRRASKGAADIQRALNDRLAAWKGMIGKAPELMAEAAAALRASEASRARLARAYVTLFASDKAGREWSYTGGSDAAWKEANARRDAARADLTAEDIALSHQTPILRQSGAIVSPVGSKGTKHG